MNKSAHDMHVVPYNMVMLKAQWSHTNASQQFNRLQNDETFKRQLAAADASRLHTVVENKLGVAARMELDFGDRMYGPIGLCASGLRIGHTFVEAAR